MLGGYWVPSDGAGKGVRSSRRSRGRAEAAGARFVGGVTVTGFDTTGGRIHAVETAQGRVECERVLLCAGLWGPTVGAMAGVPIPLVAVQHQLVWTDPVPELAGLQGDTWAQHPIVRHQDLSLYFRQRDDHYGVGNYRHEPIVTPQSAIRAPGGAMQPSLMPFTPEDFDVCEAETARMFPALAGRMRPSDPGALAERDVLVHARRGLDRRRERDRPRVLGLRGGVGHARGGHGAPGGRMDGGRRADV